MHYKNINELNKKVFSVQRPNKNKSLIQFSSLVNMLHNHNGTPVKRTFFYVDSWYNLLKKDANKIISMFSVPRRWSNSLLYKHLHSMVQVTIHSWWLFWFPFSLRIAIIDTRNHSKSSGSNNNMISTRKSRIWRLLLKSIFRSD